MQNEKGSCKDPPDMRFVESSAVFHVCGQDLFIEKRICDSAKYVLCKPQSLSLS